MFYTVDAFVDSDGFGLETVAWESNKLYKLWYVTFVGVLVVDVFDLMTYSIYLYKLIPS